MDHIELSDGNDYIPSKYLIELQDEIEGFIEEYNILDKRNRKLKKEKQDFINSLIKIYNERFNSVSGSKTKIKIYNTI